jgi:transcriptional regulator with XRE-family HTH domain
VESSSDTASEPWTDLYTPEDLGRFVADLRKARALTQAQLAEELGVTRQYISEMESGQPNLYSERLFQLFRLLHGNLRARYSR